MDIGGHEAVSAILAVIEILLIVILKLMYFLMP